MVDIFGTLVNLVIFLGSVIFIYYGWFWYEYFDYKFQVEQYDGLIKYAEKIKDEREQDKNKFLKSEFEAKYGPQHRRYLKICVGIIFGLIVLVLLFSIPLHYFAQTSQINENSVCANQNITYIVNNYYYNYTIEQIAVDNENQAFSVKELKYLLQKGKEKYNFSSLVTTSQKT